MKSKSNVSNVAYTWLLAPGISSRQISHMSKLGIGPPLITTGRDNKQLPACLLAIEESPSALWAAIEFVITQGIASSPPDDNHFPLLGVVMGNDDQSYEVHLNLRTVIGLRVAEGADQRRSFTFTPQRKGDRITVHLAPQPKLTTSFSPHRLPDWTYKNQ